MAEIYNVDGKFHLAGVSSGGLGAFRIALEHPELFQSMTVLPGIPPLQREFNEMVRLKGLRVSMYVGARNARRWSSTCWGSTSTTRSYPTKATPSRP